MARARNIKPGLFKNEILGVADPLYTLLFEGLWLLADREGRLEDRPLRIKGELFPYRDGLDLVAMLGWLERAGFILRYQANGQALIQIRQFTKHQSPHKNEAPSELPAPPDYGGTTSEEIGTTRADCGFLTPDCGLLEVGAPDGADQPKPKGRKTRLPDDFTPDEVGRARAIEAGLSVDAELQKFRDHHEANGSLKLNWQAAWRTWVSKAVEFGSARKPAHPITVPGRPGKDPALQKLEEDAKKAAPIPLDQLERMARIRQGVKA